MTTREKETVNSASLALCQELFALSQWDDTRDDWLPDKEGHYEIRGGSWYNKNPRIPAYDLSYLLQKLPGSVKGDTYRLGLVDNVQSYRAGYYNERFWEAYEQYGDTPEDAMTKVAIRLFRQGVLPE